MVDQQLCTPFDTNVQQRLEQLSWNYAGNNEWPLTQQISKPDVFVQISALEESVHYAHCVVVTPLQQELSVVIYVSITVLSNQTFFPHPSISLNLCFETSAKDHGLDSCTVPLSLDTWMKHREWSMNFNLSAHTRPPIGVHSSTQLASSGLTSFPTPAWTNVSGSSPE